VLFQSSSLVFNDFQSLSLVVKKSKNATAVGMIQLSARTQASCCGHEAPSAEERA
jgi:hypothetical protein